MSCACQQDSNSVALDVQDLVLKLQAFATSRHARRNAPRGPRGISCRRRRRRRQQTGQHIGHLTSRRNDTRTPSNTNTESTLPTDTAGDASQLHSDAPGFSDVEEILFEVPHIEVAEIDLTWCMGSEDVQKAVDSAKSIRMAPCEFANK